MEVLSRPDGSLVRPNIQEFKSWLRKREADYYNALLEYGDLIKKGRQIYAPGLSPKAGGVLTGERLCFDMAEIIRKAMIVRYGCPEEIGIYGTTVLMVNYNPRGNVKRPYEKGKHWWLRVRANDNRSYSIDGTFGQNNPQVNRIAIFKSEDEPTVYQYSPYLMPRNYTHQIPRFTEKVKEKYSKEALAKREAIYQVLVS